MEFEEGDRIFVTTLHGTPEEVRATLTISQRLAEAFKRNTDATRPSAVPLTLAEGILDHLQEFSSIFSKESFNILPDPKPWDHAIELVPGEKQSGCKVYPLSPLEQKELDAFLQENLKSRHIQPLKSPMASPVFFIKKKDGTLQLVQDYQALNVIMVKNKYPLLLISELIEKLWGAKYFTKLDIRWGFNNVRMKEGDPAKVAGVAEWPVLSTKKEVQSFLGFTNFYQRFIWDFSHHARPLFDLTKNDVKWHWSSEEQSAFDTLKGLITSAPILASLDNT